MKPWTSNLRTLLRLAMGKGAAHFEITEKRRDGVLVVRPTQEVIGIGERVAKHGLLPADAPLKEYELLIDFERHDDLRWECRYLHIRCRAGRRFAPMDAKLAIGWPVRNTDIVVTVLRRMLKELFETARALRRAAAIAAGRERPG